MSGPDEVERLIGIMAEGVRRKMVRPKCLARPSWTLDPTTVLLSRVYDECEELNRALAEARRMWSILNDVTYVGGFDKMTDVFDETCDLAAFGAMLVDRRRLKNWGYPVGDGP